MNKRSIIEQIISLGAVAALTTGRNVEMVRNTPVHATLSTPIYMKKDSVRKGDKIAVIDMDEGVAYLCTISQAETRGPSKIQVIALAGAKKVRLEE